MKGKSVRGIYSCPKASLNNNNSSKASQRSNESKSNRLSIKSLSFLPSLMSSRYRANGGRTRVQLVTVAHQVVESSQVVLTSGVRVAVDPLQQIVALLLQLLLIAGTEHDLNKKAWFATRKSSRK